MKELHESLCGPTIGKGHTDFTNEWLINTQFLRDPWGATFLFLLWSIFIQVWRCSFGPEASGVVSMQLLWQEKNSINKIRLHRQTGNELLLWQPPLHNFSPESRSVILDAGDAGESDPARLGKWQTVKTLVITGNPESVSRPDGINTVYVSFKKWNTCHASIWWGEKSGKMSAECDKKPNFWELTISRRE